MPEPSAPTPPVSLADIAAQSLKVLIPVMPPASGLPARGKYCAVMHANLCQMEFVGLSDTAAQRLAKVRQSVLNTGAKCPFRGTALHALLNSAGLVIPMAYPIALS